MSAGLSPFLKELDATCPGSDGGVAASVGMENRERVSGAGFAPDRHQHAAPPHQRVEDASVVWLKADAPHGTGNPDSGQIARVPLQYVEERTASDNRPDARRFDARSGVP